jgi:hypothetical protein
VPGFGHEATTRADLYQESAETSRDSPVLGSSILSAVGDRQTPFVEELQPTPDVGQQEGPPASKPIGLFEAAVKTETEPAPSGGAGAGGMEPAQASSEPMLANGADEVAAKAQKAADLLIRALGDEAASMAAGSYSQFAKANPAEATATLRRKLVAHGGKTGAANDAARLFLQDWADFVDLKQGEECARAVVDGREAALVPTYTVWPIGTPDAEVLRAFLVEKQAPTAANRVAPALAYLRSVGARVEGEMTALGTAPVRVLGPKPPPTEAGVPPPVFLIYLENWVRLTPTQTEECGEFITPMTAYIANDLVGASNCPRGGGFAESRVASKSEVVARTRLDESVLECVSTVVCSEDKGRRLDVVNFFTYESLVYPGACPWRRRFMKFHEKNGHMSPDWVPHDNSKGKKVTDPCGFNYKPFKGHSGPGSAVHYAAKTKAVAAIVDARVKACGFPLVKLKAMGVGGTHWWRKLGAEVVGRARWGDTAAGAKQADAIGDWATPKSAKFAPPQSKAGAKSTREKVYQPNHSMKEQVEARLRYARLLQTAFAVYGVNNVTNDTTWADLLPADPPLALAKYYGEQTVPEVPLMPDNADIEPISFDEPKPPPKRARRAVATKVKPSL